MNPSPLAEVSYNHLVVAISFLIATFASYVALDLAKRVRTPDRAIARGWWVGGSIAMGTGIWSMHFVGMLAMTLPFEVGYGYVVTALSWLAAVVVSAIALYVASRSRLNARRLIVGSLTMGVGICAMHYTGMASLEVAPGIQWDHRLVALSALIAVSASAVALLIFFGLKRLSGVRARQGQLLAALVMGTAICGMHYTGMAAASFAMDSVCLTANQMRGDSLGFLVTVASTLMLSLTMFTSMIDARMQSKAEKLATSLQNANSELQQIAFRDPLTGLPNRLLFEERLGSAVARTDRGGSHLGVLFIDLDGFKPINDTLGHHVGDAVLCEVGRRITQHLRGSDTVARVGGDEFVVLLEGGSLDSTAIAQTSQRIIEALNAPMREDDSDLRISCSIGIATYPADGPLEHLLSNADAAMYTAKRSGGTCFAFFEPSMNEGVREQLSLQRDLRIAVERGEFEMHYQPKISAGRSVITGVEALVRWRHPERGLLGPALFIPIAEKCGVIGALGYWVIEETCRQVAAWQTQGLRLRAAINLSVHQLRQKDLAERILASIQRHGLDPALLTFEITESVAMENGEGTLLAFEALRGIGTQLSIDDFGTGYSSLSYLRRLQAGELKIDRSFIRDLGESDDARAIVEAVIRLAHTLGLTVVAESVETDAQRAVLTALECDELQGFLFAKPMLPANVAAWSSLGTPSRPMPFSPSTLMAV